MIRIFISLGFLAVCLTTDPCSQKLVTGPFGVPDSQITSSSSLVPKDPNTHTGPERARLYTNATKQANGSTLLGAWIAATNNKSEYIQVELNDNSLIRGITTQGENILPGQTKPAEYTALYHVATSMDGQNWTMVQDASGNVKTFMGNVDSDTPVDTSFPCPVFAKYVRIIPEAWSQQIALRFDVNGCQVNNGNQAPVAAKATTPLVTQGHTSPQTTTVQAAQTTTQAQAMQTTTQAQAAQTTTAAATQAVTTQRATTTASQTTSPLPVVATVPAVNPAGTGHCTRDCVGKANGDYQRCDSKNPHVKVCDKHGFATCSNGILYEMPCPPGLVWNDNAKYCDYLSPTCA